MGGTGPQGIPALLSVAPSVAAGRLVCRADAACCCGAVSRRVTEGLQQTNMHRTRILVVDQRLIRASGMPHKAKGRAVVVKTHVSGDAQHGRESRQSSS